MATNNIGKLFYEDYYSKDINFIKVIKEGRTKETPKPIKDINEKIKNSTLYRIKQPFKLKDTFEAKVLYPGLITGTGLVHNSKGITGGYNLGMHFDYTTGMPIVYGSSVKGVLRQYFVDFCKSRHNVPEEDAKALWKEIFEGKRKEGERKEGNIPMYERDVFFDAVITKTCKDGYFLADDSITPHTQGPLKNPVPITMLKIATGCTLEFRFLLHKSEINGKTYDENFKLEVFKDILGTVGIGAKTNVGYGQLEVND